MSTVTRAGSVTLAAFLGAFVAGCKADKTQAEIAADLGMNLSSFRTRLVAVRKEVKAKTGKDLPVAKRASGERTSGGAERVATINSLLADLDAEPAKTEGTAEAAPVAEGEVTA